MDKALCRVCLHLALSSNISRVGCVRRVLLVLLVLSAAEALRRNAPLSAHQNGALRFANAPTPEPNGDGVCFTLGRGKRVSTSQRKARVSQDGNCTGCSGLLKEFKQWI